MMRRIGVGIGILELPFEDGAGFWRWIDLCEAGGIDSFWQSDRLMGKEPVLECLTALAAVAGRTRRMKFGMNVLSISLRDPILVAKQCATIDVLSNGRLLPAFGIGSPLIADWKSMGIDPAERGGRADEGLQILRRLWSEDAVTFDGRYYHLQDASIVPKPVQKELPIWIGGSSEAAIRRTARFGTGWHAAGETPALIGPVIRQIRAAAAEHGRRIDEDHYGAGFPFRFGSKDEPGIEKALAPYRKFMKGADPLDYFAIGDAGTILDRLNAYIDAGASKFILRPLAHGTDEMLAQTRRLIQEVLPKVRATA